MQKLDQRLEAATTRSWTLIATMAALGNVLGLLSIGLGQLPVAGISQVALDFSNVPVVFLAIFLGRKYGALTGLLAGVGPAFMFGYITGNAGLLSLVFVPLGKLLTGLSVGSIAQALSSRQKLKTTSILIAILVGFIPEALLILPYFQFLLPLYVPNASFWAPALALPVFVKAWAEMIVISFLVATAAGNRGFAVFVSRYFPASRILVSLPDR